MKSISELACWLAINCLPGMGPCRLTKVFSHFKSLINCFNNNEYTQDFKAWCQQHSIVATTPPWQEIEITLKWAEHPQHAIVCWDEPCYPRQLKEIATPPPLLFVAGESKYLSAPQLALVGSRMPTPQGRQNAYDFAKELARQGWVITSGLALGVDGASHEGALAGNGSTVAVLGSGLNHIYPYRHQQLAEKIISQGALISEFPLNSIPNAKHFPQRNRIISGLSQGVVVIEAALKSGSLITAKLALEQGREVFALPSSIHNPLGRGCHYLLREGAKCVEHVSHILEELPSLHSSASLDLPSISLKTPTGPARLLTHIEENCTPLDAIIEKAGLPAAEVSSMLVYLELTQQVAAVPGGYLRLVPVSGV